jgi:hypothetical protein
MDPSSTFSRTSRWNHLGAVNLVDSLLTRGDDVPNFVGSLDIGGDDGSNLLYEREV